MTINKIERHKLGLYIHIPFCLKKCNYCDFISFDSIDHSLQRTYFDALNQELESYLKKSFLWTRDALDGREIDTVFFGGGTPSSVDAGEISPLMKTLYEAGHRPKEVTLEANPGTLTEEKLSIYMDSGINRISLGVQSFNNEELALMGRIHQEKQVYESVAAVRQIGFKNLNLDLIFGLPGQTLDLWKENLGIAISLEPEHLSFYSLQIEENTPFYNWYRKGLFQQISDEDNREMYYHTLDMLSKAGYVHYEFSNSAKPGFECRHNLKYWSMEEYLGIGLGASSFVDGVRFQNNTDFNEYIKDSESSVIWSHKNSSKDQMSEFMFTGLRKVKGISEGDFYFRFGLQLNDVYGREVEKLVNEGFLKKEKGWIALTQKGVDLSNRVLANFV